MESATHHNISFFTEGFAFLLKQSLVKSKNKNSRAVILLYGVGCNEEDLASLSNKLPGDLLIITPQGAIKICNRRYARYPIDFSTGKPLINEELEQHSSKLLIQFIIEVKIAYHINEIYAGRFSQGAIYGKINRKDWGLNRNAALETGGVLVSNEVLIMCEVQLVKFKKRTRVNRY